MQIGSDTQTSLTPNPDELRVRDFLSGSTFLKPRFRIAVAPRSGELQVRVEASAGQVFPRVPACH